MACGWIWVLFHSSYPFHHQTRIASQSLAFNRFPDLVDPLFNRCRRYLSPFLETVQFKKKELSIKLNLNVIKVFLKPGCGDQSVIFERFRPPAELIEEILDGAFSEIGELFLDGMVIAVEAVGF